jgi:TolB-like protein
VTDAETGDWTERTWAKLRRRKVAQWGIAYAAGAWGLLQGLEFVTDTFHWPEQFQQLATIALLVGLPIVLVLAWYHGDRGQQRVTATELMIITLLFLIGGGIFWRYDRAAISPPTVAVPAGATAPTPTPVADARPSIAVLPFVNMSGDKDNEYFSDGISEELLNVLVRVEGLGVASRTSSFGYKGSTLGTRDIARALKVNHILEGSVRKSGNQVRITAQLIDATNDRHLWSETYARELNDIFAIQEEIANAIVAAMRDKLGQAHGAAPVVTVRKDTANLEAYQLYLKARELFIARRNLSESMQLFEQVTQLDPGFARGWEGLAAVYAVAPSWNIEDRDYPALTKSVATKALELDPTLSMPWAALASAEQRLLPVNWVRIFELHGRATAADPHNATAFLWRGIGWVNTAYFDRAIADFDRCLGIDPLYQNCTRWKAIALLYAGRTDQALRLFEQGVAAGFVVNRADTFVAPLLRSGNRLAATLLLQQLGASPNVVTRVLASLEHPGPVPAAEIEAVVREVEAARRAGLQTLNVARTHLWLGQYDRVSSTDDTPLTFSTPQWDPQPAGFRNSPAFKQILNNLGVPEYWREKGFPPRCRPVGAKDFMCD